MQIPKAIVIKCRVEYECETPTHAGLLIHHMHELQAFADRVARLNRDAGEIGAGMLASLVDEARRLVK